MNLKLFKVFSGKSHQNVTGLFDMRHGNPLQNVLTWKNARKCKLWLENDLLSQLKILISSVSRNDHYMTGVTFISFSLSAKLKKPIKITLKSYGHCFLLCQIKMLILFYHSEFLFFWFSESKLLPIVGDWNSRDAKC